MRAAGGLPGRPTTPTAPPSRRHASSPTRSSPSASAEPTRHPRAATGLHASTPNCVAPGTTTAVSAPRRWSKTTVPDPAAAARADLIRRDFTVNAAAVNTRWCGDITYIPTWEGWLYLATVIDIASRRVVSFALAEHLRTELVTDALTNAVAARDPAPGLVFHADRGCQYTSGDYATLADDLAVILSSGRTGQCWDNALAESFFASLRTCANNVTRPG